MDASKRVALGSYFKFIAQQKGLTQSSMATQLGLDRTSISKVFAGQIKSDDSYARVVSLFGLSLDDAVERAVLIQAALPDVAKLDEVSEPGAYVIAVATEKGGSGKTTTAVHLASAFAQMGHRTLLVDIDPQGNATHHLGLTESDGDVLASLLRKLIGLEDLEIEESDHGVDLIAGGRAVATSRGDLMAVSDGTGMLRLDEIVRPLRAHYDRILIDTPPEAAILQGNALAAADGVVSPIDPSNFSIQGMEKVLASTQNIRRTLNPELDFLGCVLTRYDKRTKVSRMVARHLDRADDVHCFETRIRIDTKVPEAQIQFMPVDVLEPSSRAARDYRSLAREIEEAIDERR